MFVSIVVVLLKRDYSQNVFLVEGKKTIEYDQQYFDEEQEVKTMECPRCGSLMEGGICNNCGFPVTMNPFSVSRLRKHHIANYTYREKRPRRQSRSLMYL